MVLSVRVKLHKLICLHISSPLQLLVLVFPMSSNDVNFLSGDLYLGRHCYVKNNLIMMSCFLQQSFSFVVVDSLKFLHVMSSSERSPLDNDKET